MHLFYLNGKDTDPVKQATTYFAIVLFVIMGFTVFLFSFIIPKFSALLSGLHIEQPLLTRVVFDVGDFAKNSWFYWLLGIFIVLVGIPLLKRFSPRFAFAWDGMKLKLPIFGELNLMLAISKFAHNLSILYRGGHPIVQALEMCQSGLIGNKVIEKAVYEVEKEVKTGSTISEALHRQTVFSAMRQRMAAQEESTGNLDKSLDAVSEYYNDVILRKIKKIFAVLELALILFSFGIVGFVALAIYLPIVSLMGAIK
jgi:type IV pilus assembly protein PilC